MHTGRALRVTDDFSHPVFYSSRGRATTLFDDPHLWWQWPNTLGADAPAVAILWQLQLAESLQIHVRVVQVLVLGLLCWIVYGLDYLADGLKEQAESQLPHRHRFFRTHARVLKWTICGAAIICGTVADQFLASDVFMLGLLASGAVFAYLLVVHLSKRQIRSRWPREFVVALLFALGTAFFVLADAGWDCSRIALPFAVLGSLCALNCAGVEYWDWRKRVYPRERPSAAAIWVGRRLQPLCLAFCCLVLALGVEGWLAPMLVGAGVVSGISLFLLSLQAHSSGGNRLRALADLALFSPGIFLLFRGLR